MPDVPMTSTTADEIEAVLRADLCSYLARDKIAWEKSWVHDSRFQSIMECGTMQIARSYEAFRQNVFEAMDAAPDPVDASFELKNLKIETKGDMAWVTFEQIVTKTSDPMAVPNHSHNFRLLERNDGDWKILFHGCWAELLRDITNPAIEVSDTLQVVWMNDAASEWLRHFSGLSISQGILRAAKPAWDKGLRETVAQAQKLKTFGKFNQAASNSGGPVTFPVVLGEDDEGALLTCWVRVADGRVYVLFGENPDLSAQLDVVKVIYGLSETQAELVRLIAQGLGLSEVAVELGITKNTARTHLRRTYEKVGVSSQIELLRTLVSFSVL